MTERATIARESTGDVALDAILGGGLPTSSLTILAGEPGTGKTILSLQIMFAAARAGKQCVYFTTLSEPALKVIRYMQQFAFFDAALIDSSIHFVDLGGSVHEGTEQAHAKIASTLEQRQPQLVIIDSYRAIGDLLHTTTSARSFAYALSVELIASEITTLLVGEYTRDEIHSLTEFAVADGIIHLASRITDLTQTREIEVVKLRGASYVSGRHFYDITGHGLVFYPRVRGGSSDGPAITGAREHTGVVGLDAMLRGGVPRNSATILQGGTGIGKSLLALQFLIERARHGQAGVYFTLEETPEQVRSAARAVGWDVEALEQQGLVVIDYSTPVELSTDRFLDHTRRRLRETKASRAVPVDARDGRDLAAPLQGARLHARETRSRGVLRVAGPTTAITKPIKPDELLRVLATLATEDTRS